MEQVKEKMLTVREISKLFSIHPNSIYYYISTGEIPFLKLGKHIRFEYSKVLEFMKENGEKEQSLKRQNHERKKMDFKNDFNMEHEDEGM